MDFWDAVVVGAGPAGSATARELARGGARVLLVEEHQQVGEPCHCSGLVTPRTLAAATVGDACVLNAVRGAEFVAPGGVSVQLGGDRVRALVLDRVGLDLALAAQAQEAGAHLQTGVRAASFRREAGTVVVGLRQRAGTAQVRTRLLIGADGASSRVAHWVGLPPPDERVRSIGGLLRLPRLTPGTATVFVGHQLAPGWFGWLIPVDRHHARVGIGTTNGRAPLECLAALRAGYPRIFAGSELLSLSGGVIPLGVPPRSHADNVLLVGDAARQVKPSSGGGIYTSLLGAKLCARTALEALRQDDCSEGFLARYHHAWVAGFGQELRRGADLRSILFGLQDEEMAGLLRLFQRPPLRQLALRYGDIDYPSRLAQVAASSAPALYRFVRTGLRWPELWRRLTWAHVRPHPVGVSGPTPTA